MIRLKTKERISIIEAVDILSSLSEIESKFPLKSWEMEHKDALHPERWLNEDRIQENEELLKDVFDAVHHYLVQMHKKYQGKFTDEVEKGIEAIVLILQEAKEKIVHFTGIFQRGFSARSLEELKEYQEVIGYLDEQILPNLPNLKRSEGAKPRKEDIKDELPQEPFEDLEEIKQDSRYELFYLKREDGKPFYDQECLRRLQLLYNFERVEEAVDPFFIKLKLLESKDFQKRAVAILVGTDSLVRDFYKIAFKTKNNMWASSISKALMSLMLAATPHSISPKEGFSKTASGYFSDFRGYLREVFESAEYKKFALKEEGTPSEERFALLTHKLCSLYFLSISTQKEVISFLKTLAHVEKKHLSTSKLISSEDKALREALHAKASGPVKKIVLAFLRGDFEEGWDPLAQDNAPSQIFTFQMEGKEVKVLHMAAPLRQRSIHEAKIVEEFQIFLQKCVTEQEKKILLVDLQDSTSFDEHGRVLALQRILENKDQKVSILRLAKQTDFYFQRHEYEEEGRSSVFLNHLKQQVLIGGACGFFFPKKWDKESLKSFLNSICEFVHEAFFGKQKALSKRERQDFIEIFYAFLLLKTVEFEKPDYLAFISKDGLDQAVCSGAEFFFAVKSLFFDHVLKQKDQDFLLWLLYAPVLMLRERVVHRQEAERVMHFMQTLEQGIAKNASLIEKELQSLYPKGFIEDVEIN